MKVETQAKLMAVVRRYKSTGATAATIGYELWGTRMYDVGAAKYARPAGKLLKAAQRLGLVYERQDGASRLWIAMSEL